jgi:hypothetical protein
MPNIIDNLSENFILNWNSRPLLLPFVEVQAMRNAIGEGVGSLIICPAIINSEGISEQIITLRYILYKKNEDNNFIPVRFDFKPVLGVFESYYDKLALATIPNFEVPQATDIPAPPAVQKISLDIIFNSFLEPNSMNEDGIEVSTNRNNYYTFFLQKYINNTIGLETAILTKQGGGGGTSDEGPGGVIIASGNPPH